MVGPLSTTFDPIHVPDHVWARHRDALATRDVGALFHLARRYAGASQNRISMVTGIPQSRVCALMNRKAGSVVHIEVLHHIADGLNLPDDARVLMGLAPRHPHHRADYPAGPGATRPHGALDTATALLPWETDGWEDPVERREFLHATAGTAVLGAGPSATPGRVGEADVTAVEHAVDYLNQLDQQHGGDHLGYFAERLVGDVQRLLRGSYGPGVAAHLHSVHGETCVLAGWLAHDAWDVPRALHWYSEGMAAAQMADDPLLGAHACACMSFLSAAIGQPSRAVQCARAGQRAAERAGGGPRLRALLHVREAVGLAGTGDRADAHVAMARAQQAMESQNGEDPGWTEFLSEAELAGVLGQTHALLGEHPQARSLLDHAATHLPGHPRNATGWQLHLALTHAAAGDPGAAAHLSTQALPGVLELSSTRIRTRLRQLDRALATHQDVSEVADFREQAREAGLVS